MPSHSTALRVSPAIWTCSSGPIPPARRALEAVREFGFPSESVAPDYLLEQRKILQLGRVPVQVHIMTSVTGLDWETAWASRVLGSYGGVPVYFIGRKLCWPTSARRGGRKTWRMWKLWKRRVERRLKPPSPQSKNFPSTCRPAGYFRAPCTRRRAPG